MYQIEMPFVIINIFLPIISFALSLVSIIIMLFMINKLKKYKSENIIQEKLAILNNKIMSLEKAIQERVSESVLKHNIDEVRNSIISLEEKVKNLEVKFIEERKVRERPSLQIFRRPIIRGTIITPQSLQQYISLNPLISSGIIFDSNGMIIESTGIGSSEGERIASYMYEVIRSSEEAMIKPEIILFQGDKGYEILIKLSEINGTEIFAFLYSRVQPSFTQCLVIRDALKKYVEKMFKRG
ncbi:MAG TPA: hypothetical protein ENG40_04720 [Thermoprotei archaeon]|nr:hypothetical protein [Thermoprotei archaeon]